MISEVEEKIIELRNQKEYKKLNLLIENLMYYDEKGLLHVNRVCPTCGKTIVYTNKIKKVIEKIKNYGNNPLLWTRSKFSYPVQSQI